MSRNINEIIGSENELYKTMGDAWRNVLRVACPGIIQSFDAATQTCIIQLTIREQVIKEDLSKEWVSLPLLLDVPIVMPRAGGYSMTLPVREGDECLVIFLDSCIDAWWSNGGIQNQIEKRRHDMSDAIAILGIWSQPNVVTNYSTDSLQIRNDNGSSIVELKDNEIDLISNSVKINGIDFNKHTHTAPSGGGQTSQPS